MVISDGKDTDVIPTPKGTVTAATFAKFARCEIAP